MSIRLIAIELYRAQKKVEQLEKQLEDAPLPEKESLREKLRVTRAELHHLRKMLDGAKTPSHFSHQPSFLKGRR